MEAFIIGNFPFDPFSIATPATALLFSWLLLNQNIKSFKWSENFPWKSFQLSFSPFHPFPYHSASLLVWTLRFRILSSSPSCAWSCSESKEMFFLPRSTLPQDICPRGIILVYLLSPNIMIIQSRRQKLFPPFLSKIYGEGNFFLLNLNRLNGRYNRFLFKFVSFVNNGSSRQTFTK